MNLLMLFIVMNIINVIIQTIKTIVTIKCGKGWASAINAIAYGLYTYITVLTMCDLPLLTKCIVVALANFVGVFIVKWGEEKARKDKLWKIEATVYPAQAPALMDALNASGIPWNYIDVKKYVIFNIYSATQGETIRARELLADAKAKYFISESKT